MQYPFDGETDAEVVNAVAKGQFTFGDHVKLSGDAQVVVSLPLSLSLSLSLALSLSRSLSLARALSLRATHISSSHSRASTLWSQRTLVGR